MKEDSNQTVTLDREVFEQLMEFCECMDLPLTHVVNDLVLRPWLDKVAPGELETREMKPMTPRFDATYTGYAPR
jgi:hypothetical protein